MGGGIPSLRYILTAHQKIKWGKGCVYLEQPIYDCPVRKFQCSLWKHLAAFDSCCCWGLIGSSLALCRHVTSMEVGGHNHLWFGRLAGRVARSYIGDYLTWGVNVVMCAQK